MLTHGANFNMFTEYGDVLLLFGLFNFLVWVDFLWSGNAMADKSTTKPLAKIIFISPFSVIFSLSFCFFFHFGEMLAAEFL